MYFFFIILLILALLTYLFCRRRMKKICKKIRCMPSCEKNQIINELVMPFGYRYICQQDIFSTTKDAWQRDFGYMEAYNRSASYFSMVFDNQPIYFDYNGRTWLIQLWKGQYGINSGGEVGIYCSDEIVPPQLRKLTLFYSVKDKDMLDISIRLYKNNQIIGRIKDRHWWLSIFDLGEYSNPHELSMDISITFTNKEMRNSFILALIDSGYSYNDIYVAGGRVYFKYNKYSDFTIFARMQRSISQWKNRMYCKLFFNLTAPFSSSLDRALCLYYYIPFAFRHLFSVKHCKK